MEWGVPSHSLCPRARHLHSEKHSKAIGWSLCPCFLPQLMSKWDKLSTPMAPCCVPLHSGPGGPLSLWSLAQLVSYLWYTTPRPVSLGYNHSLMKEGVQKVYTAALVALALPSVPLMSTFNITPLAILPDPSQGVGQNVSRDEIDSCKENP